MYVSIWLYIVYLSKETLHKVPQTRVYLAIYVSIHPAIYIFLYSIYLSIYLSKACSRPLSPSTR